MIAQESLLKVADNSGAIEVRFIKLYKAGRRYHAGLNDLIMVSVKRFLSTSPFKKGQLCHAVIVSTRRKSIDNFGVETSFGDNAVVLVTIQKKGLQLVGSRVHMPSAKSSTMIFDDKSRANFRHVY